MDSPSLSRSPSATFKPGAHRRSHPNLHHLSLVPLTPKYPIDPADYNAYFDPTTSELHTSASLSHVVSLPSPGGILTNSPARSRASSRRRKAKSTVSIREPYGAITSEGFGHKKELKIRTDSSWLIQTGLTLTEGSRESKGQSWITKRESSTSLHNPEDWPRSGRATPRSQSRRSRRDLLMISAAQTPKDEVVPDWADTNTQAEIAAQVASEFDQDDPYGILDFEEQYESDDEQEVRQAMSRYKLGQWMDGLVDTLLSLEDEPFEEETEQDNTSMISDIEPPPVRPKGLWDDVVWFGRLLARTVKS